MNVAWTVLLFPFLVFQDIIYKVKTAFNEEFDTVVQRKEQEIARVKERNLKIQEILEQLELEVEVWEPVLTDDEVPERALTVQDSEVSEKCIFVFHPFKPSSLILLISRHCVSTEKPSSRCVCLLKIIFSHFLPFPF